MDRSACIQYSLISVFFQHPNLRIFVKPEVFWGGIPDPVIPGYETVNGSLGHGLGVATGIALALKRKGASESVFVVCGDGELHEGSNWEAIMFASQHRLDNLNVIIDNNAVSMLGFTDDIVSHTGFRSRFEAFGWSFFHEPSGQDVDRVLDVLTHLKYSKTEKPKVVVIDTIKGSGVPNLENHPLSHVLPADEEYVKALLEGTKYDD